MIKRLFPTHSLKESHKYIKLLNYFNQRIKETSKNVQRFYNLLKDIVRISFLYLI